MKSKKNPTMTVTDFPLRKPVICLMAAAMVLIFLTSFLTGGRVPSEGTTGAPVQSDAMAPVPDLMARLNNDPQDEQTVLELAEIFSRVQDWDKAILFWSKAVTLNSENLGARYHRGTALLHQQRYDEAIKDYEFILQVQPQAYQALYYLGVINKYGFKNNDAAKKYFQQALDLKPEDKEMASDLEKELATLK